MIGLKKRDMKTILKAGAKARGLSLSDFKAEIQENIDIAVNSQDPVVQERFKNYFGKIQKRYEIFATMSSEEFNKRYRNVQASEIFVSCDYC